MSVQVGRCYYHPDRGAVAVCAECGVGICKGCAVRDSWGRIVCYQCANEEIKREHKEYRKWLKESGGRFREGKDFIKPGIAGVLIVAACFTLAFLVSLYYQDYSPFREGWVLLGVAYMLFSTPFCYVKLSDWFASKYSPYASWFGLKVIVSMMLGWLFFPFFVIRFIFRKIKPKKDKTSTSKTE